MYDIHISNKKTLFLLAAFALVGFLLRLLYFEQITFGYDQARDALVAMDIWRNDPIKIIGPMTDIRGLYHGSLYWYLISPVYHFFQGDVFMVKYYLIILNLICVFLFFYVVKEIFNNKFIALLSAFIYAISFESIQYARWLSNPSPAILSTLISYYGLWLIIKKNMKGIGIFLIAWSLSVNFEFFLVYHLIIFIAVLAFFVEKKIDTVRKIASKTNIVLSLMAAALISPFIVSQVKFGFQGVKALTGFLKEEKGVLGSFIGPMDSFVDKMAQSYYLNMFGLNYLGSGLLLISVIVVCYFIAKKYPTYKAPILFVLGWFLSPLFLFSFEKLGAFFINLGNLYGGIILFSAASSYLIHRTSYKKITILLVTAILLASNVLLIVRHAVNGEVLFSVQHKMLLSDELKLVDWAYQKSNGRPFLINTVTNPLFINTTWAFLFDWYGRSKYGYMPGWMGYPQVEVFGSEVEFGRVDNVVSKDFYLIIEPTPGIPDIYINGYQRYENSRSELIESKKFGGFIIEHRRMTSETPFSRDDLYKYVIGKKV